MTAKELYSSFYVDFFLLHINDDNILSLRIIAYKWFLHTVICNITDCDVIHTTLAVLYRFSVGMYLQCVWHYCIDVC